jgi:hypothetical protein
MKSSTGHSALWILLLGAWIAVHPMLVLADEVPTGPKSIGKTCGKCPEGYVITGVTEAPGICKDGDPTLVQCLPLGANMLPVCGSCPEGYREVGSSSVPARCGNQEGGRLSQCQLERMEMNLPDPTKGGKICPPDCASTSSPGQGAVAPPPKFIPSPESK